MVSNNNGWPSPVSKEVNDRLREYSKTNLGGTTAKKFLEALGVDVTDDSTNKIRKKIIKTK